MDEVVGPLPVHKLKEYAALGEIGRDTMIRKGKDGKWVPAHKVGGLWFGFPEVSDRRKKSKPTTWKVVDIGGSARFDESPTPIPLRETDEAVLEIRRETDEAMLEILRETDEATEKIEREARIRKQRETSELSARLVACKACGNQVSRAAPSCPHCGETVPGLRVECLKCHSRSIAVGPRGFSLLNAAVGAVLIGPVGLLGGMVGRKQVEVVCRACGNRWTPSPSEWQRIES
jgi:hypothetical protein